MISLLVIVIIIVIFPLTLPALLLILPDNQLNCKLPLQSVSVEASQYFVRLLVDVVNTEPVYFSASSKGLPCAAPCVVSIISVRDELTQVVDAVNIDVKGILRIHFIVCCKFDGIVDHSPIFWQVSDFFSLSLHHHYLRSVLVSI